ncbi:hypothetical protein JB92DRAFT_3018732 [Gautieria morchelliformis]|nr:hypothetical protein JB92DRAFT_3018732 [Gautieria morchelliformis]
MPGIAVCLRFVSAAICSSINAFTMTLPGPLATLPLSVPLPNGTMELQCLPDAIEHELCFARSCCSNNGMLDIAIAGLCGIPNESETVMQAIVQYNINHQIALCHFDGHSVDNLQLLLTPNASALLDRLNRPDERV